MSSSVGRNSLIMASGTAASRVTGPNPAPSCLPGPWAPPAMPPNAYQAGSMIPQVIYTLVSGGIFNAVLVPQIVRTLKSKDAETKLNKLITLAITLLLGVTLLMAVATPVVDQTVCQRQRRNHGPRHLLHLVVHAPDLLLRPVYGDRADSRGEGPFRHVCVELGRREHHQLHRFRRVHRDVRQGHGNVRWTSGRRRKSR